MTVPLRTMAPHAELVLGSAVGLLDAERRVVEVESDAGSLQLAYSDLVVALGAVTRMPDMAAAVRWPRSVGGTELPWSASCV